MSGEEGASPPAASGGREVPPSRVDERDHQAQTPLRLVCADLDAPPLFSLIGPDGSRDGYEPAVGRLMAERMGRELVWVPRPWAEMIPAVRAGEADGLLCGQGISPQRLQQVDFTRPYAIFDESVLVRAGDGVTSAEQLAGRRVAAIAGSVNLTLATTFTDAEVVAFDGASDDVFGDMVAALQVGDVDAVVDDDVALVPLADDARFEVAFTVRSRNRWAVAVAKNRPDRLATLDDALAEVIASGDLEVAWKQWLPGLDYPMGEGA
ncbi:MAG: substrate-binding periplasmic protein [Nocardioidaceae bacterium]